MTFRIFGVWGPFNCENFVKNPQMYPPPYLFFDIDEMKQVDEERRRPAVLDVPNMGSTVGGSVKIL